MLHPGEWCPVLISSRSCCCLLTILIRFSKQWHSVDSSVQTVAELNNLLGELEGMMHSHKSDAANRKVYSDYKNSSNPYIDVVVISHEFSDHCHRDTLLELDPKTPIFASRRAAKLIKSWNHFHHVYETPSFSVEESDWRKTSLQPLPNWLGISRIETQSDALYYHSAILIAFNSSSPALTGPSRLSSSTEAIIYAPHGIYAPDLRHLPSAVPPVRTLALLHGLHDIKISVKQLNLGAHNGLQAQRICEARYWVSTHDEIKKGAGLITPFLYRKVLTLREAIEEERSKTGEIQDESSLADVREVTFAELKNGESLLLM